MSDNADTKSQNGLWENIKVIIQALLLAMVIRTVLFQPFTIPSGSMMPTLLVGDYIFVNKFAYGYSKYSLPFSPNLFSGRVLEFSEPKRGDVIVFRLPSQPDIDYIKRLIGLPGDKVQMINGVLHINGKPVPKQPDGAFTSDYSKDPGVNVPVFRETLENGVTYDSLDEGMGRGDNTQEFVVPAGHYFFMGDNRDNSLDSRFDVGYVPAENLVGRASVIFFSLGNDTSFREIWKWPTNMRWDRIFKVVR
ncbi:signal peptidase I [Rhizobium sp. XQZ8]|uniref:signal peptidase I n=1 Tax=Rhizobium populisoli TaxID=2859785 RepID=UPI001CA4BC12|nr:signal peptidase I [Rhizobium populisoli]MBW6420636.1 signal peptidase I [Rhizobium populisoli]